MNKNGWIAFFLSVIPGAGHLYLYKYIRAVVYLFLFFGVLGAGVLFSIMTQDDDPFFACCLFAAAIWLINKFDILFAIARYKQLQSSEATAGSLAADGQDVRWKNEKISVMLFSLLLPGLGHLLMGLMMRGLTFLVSFFGIAVMVVFISAVTGRDSFILFLGIIPVIWIFSLFDALLMVNRKESGETLVDRSVFEDFEEFRISGRKSKMIATMLSLFPGAGHMYLGLQKRGLQLMAGFLLSIYILDVFRLSLFLFLVPIIWFYSFFDALQHLSKYEQGEMKDVPVIDWLLNHQKWLGIGLMLLGAFYLLEHILLPIADRLLADYVNLYYWYSNYFQTTVVSVLLIGIGLKLLSGSKQRRRNE